MTEWVWLKPASWKVEDLTFNCLSYLIQYLNASFYQFQILNNYSNGYIKDDIKCTFQGVGYKLLWLIYSHLLSSVMLYWPIIGDNIACLHLSTNNNTSISDLSLHTETNLYIKIAKEKFRSTPTMQYKALYYIME